MVVIISAGDSAKRVSEVSLPDVFSKAELGKVVLDVVVQNLQHANN